MFCKNLEYRTNLASTKPTYSRVTKLHGRKCLTSWMWPVVSLASKLNITNGTIVFRKNLNNKWKLKDVWQVSRNHKILEVSYIWMTSKWIEYITKKMLGLQIDVFVASYAIRLQDASKTINRVTHIFPSRLNHKTDTWRIAS